MSRGDDAVRLTRHPRAARDIRLAKGWGGLVCFGIALLLSLDAGLPLPDAGLRAVIAGVGGTLACWTLAVTAWRHLVVAEIRVAHRRLLDELEARGDETQTEAA